MIHSFLPRSLPPEFEGLDELALDLRWTWSHAGDELWRRLDAEAWERTRNPWLLLQDVSQERLEQLAGDAGFREELARLRDVRREYLADPGWFGREHAASALRGVAYFSMEFGLGEALPLYAGGLGILAGDYLKTASDLGVPVVGVGLLYQVGYFRQVLDAAGDQHERYPYNDPTGLPIQPLVAEGGGWLRVELQLPGRPVTLRAWQARVGRATLYLLDSNDPLNSPADRGITGELYAGGSEIRIQQELVLGVGGWRLLRALGQCVDVCHLNEGHAAFAALERAAAFQEEHPGTSFRDALWTTRAGNVFTTHTPVPAGFDTFATELVARHFTGGGSGFCERCGLELDELLALGRRNPRDRSEPFNMAHAALRSCARVNGVSRLHGAVSRRLFRSVYPGWPEPEVPVDHVTNGVHAPSWDSPWSDELWTEACGKERWLATVETLTDAIRELSDARLWALRAGEREDLVRYARARLARQLGQRGADPAEVAAAREILDPNALTLGFARRFAEYKRPNLLLHDPDRLARLLGSKERPVQIFVAGKAHPGDAAGKRLVRAWVDFVRRPDVRLRAVFLEDYDMSLAQELVQGVDVWINTPRRPYEACGTSGMKVLVNGGLNLSELDGWWSEAFSPALGWALGDGREHAEAGHDAREAEELYRLLEDEILPAFFERDSAGLPRAWLARVRASMARLAPRFSSNRMLCEYVERFYLDAAGAFRRRSADGCRLAHQLSGWAEGLSRRWDQVRFGEVTVRREGERWTIDAEVFLAEVPEDAVRVELYADPAGNGMPFRAPMERVATIPVSEGGRVYRGSAPAARPAGHYTPRVVPHHDEARAPAEIALVRWQR